MAVYQRTIKSECSISGIGLHTGVECTATFKPADENTGIRFIRTDIEGQPIIPAEIEYVGDISRGTTLVKEGHQVHTVEHVLSALSGLGLDNIVVELSAKEPPVMDGSALPFVKALQKAGIQEQSANRNVLVVDKPISYTDDKNDIDMHIMPDDEFRITFMMDYGAITYMGTQLMTVHNLEEDYVKRIAPARTFGLFSEVAHLKEQGLVKGGSIENAMVFVDRAIEPEEAENLKELFKVDGPLAAGENGLLLGQELRFENEAVRHKIVDLIGDLTLLGMPIQGHVITKRSGHASNVELVKVLKKYYSKRIKQQKLQSLGKIKFNTRQLMQILPHRYPMLLIDRILDVIPGKRVRALKNVTINEEVFQGHFPGQPILPGVLMLEAMAQAGGFLLLNTVENPATKLVYFSAIDNTRFRKAVTPGDQIIFEVILTKIRMSTCKFRGLAYVDGELVAESDFMATIVDRE
ncbi:bifunctional UDP-3-O-[3-hydroxymyristoyl] N-acetylglucosamine deacetylase/3-hydroxyacyl-ACP dehydratase [Candidatus Neomarinimicrobiota bacterium]